MSKIKDDEGLEVEVVEDAPDYDGPQQRDGVQDTLEEEADDA